MLKHIRLREGKGFGDRTILLHAGLFYLLGSFLLMPSYFFNDAGIPAWFWEGQFLATGILCLFAAVKQDGRLVRLAGIFAVVSAFSRGVGLIFGIGFTLPALVWFGMGYMQTLVWAHVLGGRHEPRDVEDASDVNR